MTGRGSLTQRSHLSFEYNPVALRLDPHIYIPQGECHILLRGIERFFEIREGVTNHDSDRDTKEDVAEIGAFLL